MQVQVEVNVPYPESQAARPLVQSIMYPSRTVMDLVYSAHGCRRYG